MPSFIHFRKDARLALPPPAPAALVRTSESKQATAPATPGEKDVQQPPKTFADAQAMLWQGINEGNEQRVVLAGAGLTVGQRFRLVHTPAPSATDDTAESSAAAGLRPSLPLCVASATGNVNLVQTLLAQGARADVGDTVSASLLGVAAGMDEGEPVRGLTLLFWAAHYGQISCMTLARDEDRVPLKQVRWAVEIEAKPNVVAWLRSEGVFGDQLKLAALRATNDNRKQCVRALVQQGGVSLGTVFRLPAGHQFFQPQASGQAWMSRASTDTKAYSWLAYAVAVEKLAVANELIDLGVTTHKEALATAESLSENHLSQVIDRCCEPEKFDLYLPLVRKMLSSGVAVHQGHFKSAFHLGGRRGEELFIVLLRDGNAGPRSKLEAAELLLLAQQQKSGQQAMHRAIFILQDLGTMLDYDKNATWPDSARKEDKHVVIARARAHILEVMDYDPEDFEGLPEGAMLATSVGSPEGKGRKKSTHHIGNIMAGRSSQAAAYAMEAETGALVVNARKKRFF